MIPASKNPVFAALFAAHARGRIARTFHHFWVQGHVAARRLVAEGPVLVVSNHTSWWDPLVAMHLSAHVLGADGHALMDAKNLRRLPFFALTGAFGVDLDDPRDGARAIRHASKLLRDPGRLVWIFPQGRERPVTERPLGFRAGAAAVARVARRAVTLPVALRYEFACTERPDLYVSFGEPLSLVLADQPSVDTLRSGSATAEALASEQEKSVERELGRIEDAVRGERHAFDDLHARPPMTLDAPTRALAWITSGLPGVGPLRPR